MIQQKIIDKLTSSQETDELLKSLSATKFMIVCGKSLHTLPIKDFFLNSSLPHVIFSDFTPNPSYQEVVKGVALFNKEKCDCIVAIGGGSAIDVAKCIKLFCKMDHTKSYLEQEYTENNIPLIALPTTAGTGSESTRYAVIYHNGEKQTVTHTASIPAAAILLPEVLKTLPLYQKKCTLMDALCQAIESIWSLYSTEESKTLAKRAIEKILPNIEAYLKNEPAALKEMLHGSNLSGQAINISRTTAPHAMSYKLTTIFGLPHGHAVALCLPKVWRYMYEHPELVIDERGSAYLNATFSEIAKTMGADSVPKAITLFENLLIALDMDAPVKATEEQIKILAKSVNLHRLKNTPVKLSEDTLLKLYRQIV